MYIYFGQPDSVKSEPTICDFSIQPCSFLAFVGAFSLAVLFAPYSEGWWFFFVSYIVWEVGVLGIFLWMSYTYYPWERASILLSGILGWVLGRVLTLKLWGGLMARAH